MSKTSKTAWKVSGEDTFGTSLEWARFKENNNTYWTIPNATEASDHFLISPKFTIEDTTFSFSFIPASSSVCVPGTTRRQPFSGSESVIASQRVTTSIGPSGQNAPS